MDDLAVIWGAIAKYLVPCSIVWAALAALYVIPWGGAVSVFLLSRSHFVAGRLVNFRGIIDYPGKWMAVFSLVVLVGVLGLDLACLSLGRFQAAPGRILSNRLDQQNSRASRFGTSWRVDYEYEVDGRLLHGAAIRPFGDMAVGTSAAYYQTGKQIKVWYYPARPTWSYLDPGINWKFLLTYNILGILLPVALVVNKCFFRQRIGLYDKDCKVTCK
jgi:hypothetical protein